MILPATLGVLVLVASPAAGRPFTVALDAGHGGTNLGGVGVIEGLYEKRVTLTIALGIKARLREDSRIAVVLCRDRDELVPIRARVRCANQARADLFVSLHANASPERGSKSGFEIYVLPVESADRVAALAAARASDAAEAAWQVQRTHERIEQALEAAKRIEWELVDLRGKERGRGIRQQWAVLDVLQGLDMPGVLVEVGYLDSETEGRELARAEVQEKFAAALAQALSDLAARARRAATDPTITAGKARK